MPVTLNNHINTPEVDIRECHGQPRLDTIVELDENDNDLEDVSVQVCSTKTVPMTKEKFFQLEAQGCPVLPRCLGSQCGRCPLLGSRYSFQEQWQLDLI